MKPPSHAIDDAQRRADGGSGTFSGERLLYLEELLMLEYPFAYLEEDRYRIEDTDVSHHPLLMEVATLWDVALGTATAMAMSHAPKASAEIMKAGVAAALSHPGCLVLLRPERTALFIHGGTCSEAQLEMEEDESNSELDASADRAKRKKFQADFQRLMATSGGAPEGGGRPNSVTAEKPSTIGLQTSIRG